MNVISTSRSGPRLLLVSLFPSVVIVDVDVGVGIRPSHDDVIDDANDVISVKLELNLWVLHLGRIIRRVILCQGRAPKQVSTDQWSSRKPSVSKVKGLNPVWIRVD